MYYIVGTILFLILFFSEQKRKKNKINDATINQQVINNGVINDEFKPLKENNNSFIKKKKEINGFSVMLSVGVFLIILASIIFATSTWKSYSSSLKVLILFGETLLFLILGLVLKYAFKVANTGNALTFISAILLPSTFLCAGYFKLFGEDFSLTGIYSDIFLSITFLIEALVLVIRMLIIKNNKYVFPLVCFLAGMFLLTKGVTNNYMFAFAFTYIIVLGINYFKDKIFSETDSFKMLNIILYALFTFIYLYLCAQSAFYRIMLFKQESAILNNASLFNLLSLIILGSSLVVNFIITNKKINIFSLIYEVFIVVWLAIFTGNLTISSFILITSGLILYIVYYLLNNDNIVKQVLLLSYLQGIVGILLVSFSKDFTLMMPIVSISYLILSIISSLKDDSVRILNVIFEPVFLITFVIGVLIQPYIIRNIKIEDIVMLTSISLTIGMIISTIFNRKMKNGYFVALCLSLLVQVTLNSVAHAIFAIIINTLLVIYSLTGDDEFCNKNSLSISLLLLTNIFIGLRGYQLPCSIILILAIIIFALIYKDSNKKYLFISLACIPIIMLINYTNLKYSIKADLACIAIIPSVIIFMRKFLAKIDEQAKIAIELIIILIVSAFLSNPIFIFLYLVLIYIIGYLYSDKYVISSKVYFNYLMFISIFLFLKTGFQKEKGIFLVLIVLSEAINQLLYKTIHNKRELVFENFHALISMLLIVLLADFLKFDSLYIVVVGFISTIGLWFLYDNEQSKYLAASFIVYPLGSLIDDFIKNNIIQNILMTFIWLIPATLLLRKVMKVDGKGSNIIETIIMSIMFLMHIFVTDLTVGITLGMISLILIMIGIKFKYKSYSIIGYISLILTVLVQTLVFWSKMPWWAYILIAGIILIILAAIRESRKKGSIKSSVK